MIGFIVTSLQLQSLITAHTFNSFWIPYEEFLTAQIDVCLTNESLNLESNGTTDGQSASLPRN
jgi:hypothetical protein